METLIAQLLNGLSLGSIYALIALGYTMVYGIIQLINFAHGEILMIGAYAGFFAITKLELGFFPALIVAMVVSVVLGIIVERVAYKPLRNSTRLSALITAFGVSLFLQNGCLQVFGTDYVTFPRAVDKVTYKFLGGNATITSHQILILIITVIMMFILQYIVHKTKTGKAMRAVSYDKDAALLMGVNVDSVITVTFAIGSAFAAVAGVLWECITRQFTLMGSMPGLKAFIAAVLGGIGLFPVPWRRIFTGYYRNFGQRLLELRL